MLQHRLQTTLLLQSVLLHVLICCATIKRSAPLQIWDLESKSVVDELKPQFEPTGRKAQQHYCVSVSWSADGSTLYGGYTDGQIRVWGVGRAI